MGVHRIGSVSRAAFDGVVWSHWTDSCPNELVSEKDSAQGHAWHDVLHWSVHESKNADDVAWLAKMLEILLLSLYIMQQKGRPFYLEINWTKTWILHIMYPPVCPTTKFAGNEVEIV